MPCLARWLCGRGPIAAAGVLLLAAPLHAQDPPRAPGAPPRVATTVLDTAAITVPWFAMAPSPIGLAGPARPGQFLSAVGRRAIAMGTEDGRLEFWSWPVKWLHDFELSFQVPKYAAPIPGHTVAQRVEERPEGVTITYSHEQFTVREHVFVPLDKPAVIILLEVDAVRPLEILARFAPDIHYAWPAGLGGQYLVWEQNARAFHFSEGKQAINAFMGSPAVLRASDVPAHMLAAAPPELVLGVGGAQDRYTAPRLGEPPGKNVNLHEAFVPIVLAGGTMPQDSALALYRSLVAPGAAEREWNRRVAHADSIRETQFRIASPDSLLDLAVEYAKVNLDESMACNPDLGCGLVAGYGLSGAATDRPGFGWYFGGDASINSFAMSAAGQGELVRDGALRFFARFQRADGKITHEISQGAGRVDWWSYPYPFYHGDTTPYWILAAGEYWRRTGDTATVRALWPNLAKAYDWSRSTDGDGDGLMENPLAGAGALEVGDLQIGILSDVYLSGVWVAALDRFARMAAAMGDSRLAAEALAMRSRALATLEARFWMPDAEQYAFALLQDGTVNPALTAWAAPAMAFGVLDDARGAAMARHLASSAIMTDWGARPLASTSALFDPLHYNNGAVWPFVTGWVAQAQYAYHNAPAGWFALQAIVRTGFDEPLGRNPEVYSGRFYKPLDTAVPQQFFATSMVLAPLLGGLLGIDVDVPARTIRIAPHLPPDWDSVAVRNVPVGRDRLAFTIRRTRSGFTLDAERSGPDRTPFVLEFSPALPLGAGTPIDRGVPDRHAGDLHAAVRGTLSERATLEADFAGGWQLIPPPSVPRVGERSRAARIVAERLEGGRYVVTLEGIANTTATFRLPPPRGPERSVAVTFTGATPDADGYVRVTREFGP